MIDCDKETLTFAGEDNTPEIFYTIEGEGEYVGKPSVFLRFSGCNLTCKAFASPDSPNGCDSFVSWSQKNKLTFNETFDLLEREGYIEHLLNDAILKITGGEPLIRQKQLLKFMDAFVERYQFTPIIDFESNATLMPSERWGNDFGATFTTSPKLSTNGDPESKTYKPDVLKWHAQQGSGFKFVVTCSEDLDEIWQKYVMPCMISNDRVWLMPCCGSREEHEKNAPAVAEYAKALHVNFSARLHLVLWNRALLV